MACHNVMYTSPDTVQAGDPTNKFPQYIYGRSERGEGWLPLLHQRPSKAFGRIRFELGVTTWRSP